MFIPYIHFFNIYVDTYRYIVRVHEVICLLRVRYYYTYSNYPRKAIINVLCDNNIICIDVCVCVCINKYIHIYVSTML